MEFWIIHSIFIIICGIVAYKKHRNIIGWMACATLLSWIALVILIFLPALPGTSPEIVKVKEFFGWVRNVFGKTKGPREVKRQKPRAGSKKSKVAFRYPDEIFTYEKNAFQVLGILPKQATVRAITKRENELTNLIKAGLPIKDYIPDYCPVPWSEAKPATETDISNAHSRLQDNVKRMKEELFWFNIDETDEVYKCLREGDFGRGMNLWDSAKECDSQYTAAQALHNLAVLKHALVLKQEKNLTTNPGMTAEQIARWKEVFELWRNVHFNDTFWEYIQERAVILDDHRVHVEHLRKTLPYLILKINLEIAIAAFRQKFSEYSKQHMSLIQNSGFDSKHTEKVLKEFFNHFIRELNMIRQELEGHPKNIERAELYEEYESHIEAVRNSSTDSAKNDAIREAIAKKDKIIELAPKVINQYIPSIKRAREIKKQVDHFGGCSYIKTELEEILSIPYKQIRRDLETAIEKFILVRDEISNYANFLIEEWNKRVNDYWASADKREIKRLFEDNALKLIGVRSARNECAEIVKSGKEMFKLIVDLCCDDERRRQIKSDIESLDRQNRDIGEALSKLEAWVNNNLNTLRQSF